MGLLAQLFRHKSTSPGGGATALQAGTPEAGGDVRGVGAIAAAAGVRTEHGMPSEFSLSLGELLTRVPQHCVWPGRHDAARVLRIPAADVARGLARGKAEVSLARLVALAPEVFRWERGESDDPQVRLPIQKLLQQIRSEEPMPSVPVVQRVAAPMPPVCERTAPADSTCDARIIAEQLPSIIWEKPEPLIAPPAAEVTPPPEPIVEKEQAPAEPVAVPAPEMHEPAVQPPPGSQEPRAQISVTATEPAGRTVELRPSKDASTSTTLRAVVLGGVASSVPANATDAAGHILAPRLVPVTPAPPPPMILGPSVIPSPKDGGAAFPPRTAPNWTGLQNLFMTAAALDLPGVAGLAAALPGVRACVISGSAGSAVAGDFSHGVSADQVRAATADLARIGGAATDTLPRGESDIVLFFHDEVCVATVIAAGGFVPGVRERLARVAELLAGAPPAR